MRALPWHLGLSALMMTILWNQNTQKDDTKIDPKILEEVVSEYFKTKMTEEDIDYEAMQNVLNLVKNGELAGSETAFNELMYILFDKAWEQMKKSV